MVVLRRAMLGAGTHRHPVLSILSGDDHPEVELICARAITSSLEPGVRILHRPCRPLLRGLEQAHRAALDDHVHRPTRLGQWVLISGSWYKRDHLARRALERPARMEQRHIGAGGPERGEIAIMRIVRIRRTARGCWHRCRTGSGNLV